jgi:hypothetical protein
MNEKIDPSGNEGLCPKRQYKIKRGKIEDSSGNKTSHMTNKTLFFHKNSTRLHRIHGCHHPPSLI